ncbi:zinc finger CCCH domain-containing protein, partial [Trifolium medium]|nr:zinc finger CCCH domain-containing protein [Trifolium medium]
YGGSLTSAGSVGAATEQQKEADPSCIDAAAESENAKGIAKSEAVDLGTR